jgi:hypothetical protein
LNHGETTALLTPTVTGRWGGSFSLALLRLQALMQVHFRWGRGLKKSAAIAEVAEALGVSSATVRKWEQTALPPMLGSFRSSLSLAKRAGQLAGEPSDGTFPRSAAGWLADYLVSQRSLAVLAAEHRQLVRASSRKHAPRKLRTTPSEVAPPEREPAARWR